MTARWSLSERAGADLLAIARYTIEEHGAEQAELYRDGLIAALERIADFPRMARERTEITIAVDDLIALCDACGSAERPQPCAGAAR